MGVFQFSSAGGQPDCPAILVLKLRSALKSIVMCRRIFSLMDYSPVRVPFTVGPDLERGTAPLSAGPGTAARHAAKLHELHGPLRNDLIGAAEGAEEGIALLAAHLGATGTSIDALALECDEDLALLHRGVLQAIAFAFPSGFRPTAKLGLNFAAVHAPVAEGATLRAASPGISAAISRQGAVFTRGVWTLTPLGTLSQHPSYPRPNVHSMDQVFFRTEFQVMHGLGMGWCGFSVRVNMTPWPSLVPEEQQLIAASLASMSPASRSYKNLHEIAAILGV